MSEIEDAGPADLEAVRALFLEYAQSLGFSLCFQGFDKEMAGLPGDYAPPAGRLLVARADGAVVGCVGLRPLEVGRCEMKRLYVRSAYRGRHLGRRLAEAAIAAGRASGYARMGLETLESMTAARRLYADFGFRELPPDGSVIYAERML
jgi:ribosomal protein S18 acetylase RimI-like enzyme